MSGVLTVQFDGKRYEVPPGGELDFGRKFSRGIVLPGDGGVSRSAGRFAYQDGMWWVVNLSQIRALLVVAKGVPPVPLPRSTQDEPPNRSVVDRSRMDVLVTGDRYTYRLTLNVDDPTPATFLGAGMPQDPRVTKAQAVQLSEERRNVLVALARTYLQPWPSYSADPGTSADVARELGITQAEVDRHLEATRKQLKEAGVPGMGEQDSRHHFLCEWVLATQLITPADLDHPAVRATAPQRRPAAAMLPPRPEQPKPGPGPKPVGADAAALGVGDRTTEEYLRQPHFLVMVAAERAGAALNPFLKSRLEAFYKDGWETGLNKWRKSERKRISRPLADDRFSLVVFGRHECTQDPGQEVMRAKALRLNRLANKAIHEKNITTAELKKARALSAELVRWATGR